eukprot:597999_1
MITSRPAATSQNAIKSLNRRLPTEESKTPEIETVHPGNVRSNEEASPLNQDEEEANRSINDCTLSTRAQRVKDSLRNKSVFKAVLLKADGSAEQIEYNTSSVHANQLLNGRPSIVGELEDLHVIIARSLNQNAKEVNAHVLPAPFCNKQYRGNYLLYRVDATGNPMHLELPQYEKYVRDNKTLTATARKNFDPIDNQEIKPKSSLNSGITSVHLRSEVDRKIRAQFKSDNGRNPTQSEIEEAVEQSLQQLVDELASSCSKMNDPDYDPQEDAVDIDADLQLAQQEEEEEAVSEDWRLQLKDALHYVRQRGRVDGRILAEKISQTFYELNGKEATLDELVDVFRRIKSALADEAQQDLEYDNGSALYLAQKLGADLKNADPSDIVEIAFRIVGQDLVHRAKSSFLICKNRQPNGEELSQAVAKLALKLADQAIAQSEEFDLDADHDYDPHNVMDTQLAQQDELEDNQWENDIDSNFGLKMLATQPVKSKTGASAAYNVYFSKSNAKRAKKNLSAAIASFKMRNDREPNTFEVHRLKQFLSTENETSVVQFKLSVVSDDSDNEEKEAVEKSKSKSKSKVTMTPSKVLVTPVKKKKTAARYNVYFENDAADKERNEKLALKWFNRFNNREPTQLELAAIQQFIKADQQLTEVEYNVPLEVDSDSSAKKAVLRKLKTDSVVQKKDSTKYTLNFDDKQEREHGDDSQAMKWFKRFNNRDPTQEEKEKIKQFIKTDNPDTIDID